MYPKSVEIILSFWHYLDQEIGFFNVRGVYRRSTEITDVEKEEIYAYGTFARSHLI